MSALYFAHSYSIFRPQGLSPLLLPVLLAFLRAKSFSLSLTIEGAAFSFPSHVLVCNI